MKTLLLCLSVAAAFALSTFGADNLHDVLGRMDKAAAAFQSMSASVAYITHTEVLNDNSTETGTVIMKKVHAGDVQGKVDFTAPDRKVLTIEKRRAQEYFPKINTVQVYDLGKHGKALDEFFLLGFGISGTELASSYDVTVAAQAQFGVQAATQLVLVPKDAEAKRYVTKVELWTPAQGDPYPLQEKIYEPSGDSILVKYTDLKINPPLASDALDLKLPPGVKIETPGK
jgi:outer membrane lipoprotein-sorting protein